MRVRSVQGKLIKASD